jgi:3-deoxy-manno-octulosonate cytidylyltransferase (CMP-KDO synthetase)
MRILGVIPARHASSRFHGKPLAGICGKPMVWWAYRKEKWDSELKGVVVATESERTLCAMLGRHSI